MNANTSQRSEPSPRAETREVKTLTLRIPPDVHEQIENAAKQCNQSLNQFIADAAYTAARAASDGETQLRPTIAVMVDLDAFSGKPLINIEALERVAASIGRPIIKSSFSTAVSNESAASRQALLARHFRHEEIQSREALRLRVSTEAIDAFAAGTASEFLIVSGDEEFALVASLLTRRGARVFGVGVRTSAETSPNFIRTFESFRFYDQIDRPPESDELKRLRAGYVDLLIQTALKLEKRGAKPVGAALIPIIKDRRPEVSLELLEIRSWKELAEIARDLDMVDAIEPSGSDFLVRLTEKGKARAQALLEATEAESAELGEIAGIRTSIAEILGTDLPDVSIRFLIFNAVQWILNEEMRSDGISLIDLSYRAVERLGSSGVQQNTVYRLLNGLYRCGAFEYLPNQANEYDPRIVRARISLLDFDNAFVLNLMRVRKKFPIHSGHESLSTAIYGTPAHQDKVARMLRISGDAQYTRANLIDALARLEERSL